MLRRFLRSISKPPPPEAPRPPTAGEAMLDSCLASVRASCASSVGSDAMEALLDAILDYEGEHGLDLSSERDREKRRQFGRSWLALMTENDAFPPNAQLGADDLRRPRSLLAGFFLNTGDVQSEAQGVLAFIEKKFSDGHFSQAGLLLQLFDTEPATRRNNERNLFYEQMILRFMATRDRTLGSGRSEEFRRVLSDSLASPGESIGQPMSWLANHAGLRFHVQTRRPGEVELWEAATQPAARPGRAELLRLVPPSRWRLLSESRDRTPAAVMSDHLARVSLRQHVLKLVRSCYFIVLATGRTGFETMVTDWMQWAGTRFRSIPTRVLPELHRLSTIEQAGIEEALDTVYENHLGESTFGSGTFSLEAITDALARSHRRLDSLDINAVPEGDYDWGGVVYDELIGFSHRDLASALRVHRLT